MARTKTATTSKKATAGRIRPASTVMAVAATPTPSRPRTRAKRTKEPVAPAVPALIPVPPVQTETGGKLARIIALLRRPQGATIEELMQLTGWLSHSVRGALSGALKRDRGLAVGSGVEPDRGRVYRITEPAKTAPAIQTASGPVPRPAKIGRAKQPSNSTGAAA